MAATLRRCLRDERGAIVTEYVALVGLVGLSLILALVAIGPTLVEGYQYTRNIVASPFP
jgi:Flp pilus assembly pilin Flp